MKPDHLEEKTVSKKKIQIAKMAFEIVIHKPPASIDQLTGNELSLLHFCGVKNQNIAKNVLELREQHVTKLISKGPQVIHFGKWTDDNEAKLVELGN